MLRSPTLHVSSNLLSMFILSPSVPHNMAHAVPKPLPSLFLLLSFFSSIVDCFYLSISDFLFRFGRRRDNSRLSMEFMGRNSKAIHGDFLCPDSPDFRSHTYSNSTMVVNEKKHRQNSHLIIHFPTSEGVSAVEGASEASSPE